jgi:hypothetical protein
MEPAEPLECAWLPAESWPARLMTLLGPVVAVAAGLFTLALGLWLVASDIPNVRGDEFHVVFSIQKMLSGGSLYSDPSQPPFDITQYSPLYYVIAIGFAKAVGITAQDAAGVTFLCRGLSFAFAVALLALTYRFMRRHLHVGKMIAIAACGFAIAITSPWYFMARPDTLMALCLFGALYAAVNSWKSEGRQALGWIAAAALLSVLATCAKQNGIQAFGILFLTLGLTRSWGRLGVMTLTFTVFGALAIGLTYYGLGTALWSNLVQGLDNGLSFYKALKNCYDPFFPIFALLTAFACVIVVSWFQPRQAPVETLMAVSLFCLLGFATATAIKVGSAVNYYNEFKLLAVCSTAAFLTHGRRIHPRDRMPAGPLVLVVSLYLVCFLLPWSSSQFYRFFYLRREPGSFVSAKSLRYSAYEPIVSWLRQEMAGTSGLYVLSYDMVLNTALPEYTVMPQRGLNQIAYERGVVNYQRLRDMLTDGRVRFLATRGERIPASSFGATLDFYKRVDKVGSYSIYEYQSNEENSFPDPARATDLLGTPHAN